MLLLVATALFVAQAINFAFLLSEVRGRRATFIEGGAVARTIDTVERVQAGLPVGRAPRRGPDRVAVTVGALAAPSGERDLQMEARVAEALTEAGHSFKQIAASRDEGRGDRSRLTVSVQLPDNRWVNLRNVIRTGDRGLIYRLVGQTLILLVALLVAVIAIGRHVARPLRLLTGAAESFGTSGRREPVPPQGPSDVQQLIATFNKMQSRILDMLAEKDRMLGAIGHDLRTPLASLRLRAEGVDDQAERERMIATIEEMAGTLEDILELARLGRSGEQSVRTDLAALVDALVQDLQDLGQAVEFDDGERLLASVRPALIRRAIRNLIENAIKYGRRADVRLHRAGHWAVLEIDDQGPGIPAGDIERVMEGFVRLDESRNRATGGSGLGLTIARSIIQEHGGSLTLQNLPERGLRAIVKLPLQP
jgi:signal transduction histidine kinase